MKTTRLPPTACPLCGKALDAATAGPANPTATPRKGDITLCFGCACVLVFEADLSIRVATGAELAEALAIPDVARVMKAIDDFRGRGRA